MYIRNIAAFVAATASISLVGVTSASAQNLIQKTNTKVTHALDKAGHATAYSTHKDYKQTSIATHRALGKNSVIHRGKGSHRKAIVVHPGGTKSLLHPTG